MSNIAICFYGHIRTWEKTKYSFIENVLDSLYPIIPDIFIHTYDLSNLHSDLYYSEEEIKSMMIFKNKFGVEIIPKIIVVANSKDYTEEIAKEAENIYKNSSQGTQNTLAIVKKIYLCHQEMKNY